MRNALSFAVLLTIGFSIPAQAANLSWFPLPLVHEVRAYVTGYNTVPGQTDDTPCIAASGANICGRTDAVACPRHISLGTRLVIRGISYVCEDRLAKKYDSRFDISCDKDTDCPNQVTGWAVISVLTDTCRAPAAPVAAPSRPAGRVIKAIARLRARLHLPHST